MFTKVKNAAMNAVMGAPEAVLQLSAALGLLALVIWAANKAKPGLGDQAKQYVSFGLLK
jgi:hypothetical protein